MSASWLRGRRTNTGGSDRLPMAGREGNRRKILRLVDKEVPNISLTARWMPIRPFQQHGQHIEYTVKPEGVDRARVLQHHRRAGGTDPRLHRQAASTCWMPRERAGS